MNGILILRATLPRVGDYACQENSQGSAPFDGSICQNIKITGCKFINCMSGIGNHHDEKKSYDWYFENNTFTNIAHNCFRIDNSDNVIIKGNLSPSIREINDFFYDIIIHCIHFFYLIKYFFVFCFIFFRYWTSLFRKTKR